MHRTTHGALARYIHRRMVDLYLDDNVRETARPALERLARERGARAEDAARLVADALDRWPSEAA